MATTGEPRSKARTPLSRERILATAVALADREGVGVAQHAPARQELGVVPMALYKHVANKEEMLDGMLDVVVGEIDPPLTDTDWKTAVRERILSARRALLRHPWASRVMESRTEPTPTVMAYMDSMIGMFLRRRVLDRPDAPRDARDGQPPDGLLAGAVQRHSRRRPADATPRCDAAGRRLPVDLPELSLAISHDEASVVGAGCDDQFEFEFALDLILDGIERLKGRGTSDELGL